MISVSAPGKVIISGEHSVVWGEPAFLAAINKRCWVKVKKINEKKIKIVDEILKVRAEVDSSKILDFAEQRKKSWQKSVETGGKEYFGAIKREALGLVKIGIGETLMSLKKSEGEFELRIKNEIPIGVGLGSSAALSVSLVAGLWEFFNNKQKKQQLSLINKIAYEIEKRQHGNPSGGDNTICTYGGFLVFKKKDQRITKKKLKMMDRLPELLLVDTGKPVETTGEMVSAVRQKYRISNIKYQKIFKKIGKVTNMLIDSFKQSDFRELKFLIRTNEQLLEELGVVGERAKKIIRLIERSGGAAKICGAGGLKKGSGMALVYHGDLSVLKRNLKKNKIDFLKVKLGEKGVTIH